MSEVGNQECGKGHQAAPRGAWGPGKGLPGCALLLTLVAHALELAHMRLVLLLDCKGRTRRGTYGQVQVDRAN